ncbi:hypothetical protein NPIL_622391 [Nephila pilipes]|uniref:Uncharacterized protein n=1 Tax=Nephila pilipes TaxID=299642 RepID=A0A8X6TVM7_NEPPI|nr:hypothetical protein NPIL_622391 [Nephila pilipes]
MSVSNCVAKSANQPLCDEFVGCYVYLPQPHRGLILQCLKLIPGGLGRCTKDQELLQSEENRKKLFECVGMQAPVELTAIQTSRMNKNKACLKAVGDKCSKKTH